MQPNFGDFVKRERKTLCDSGPTVPWLEQIMESHKAILDHQHKQILVKDKRLDFSTLE